MLDCPQCGFETKQLYEGYCEDCCKENQRNLDEHNARFDWWENLTDAERSQQIRSTI